VGDGPVKPDSWQLCPAHQKNAQGLIVSAFPDLPVGEALLLELPGAGGAWLGALMRAVPVTDAIEAKTPSVALALTSAGLQAMGLDEQSLATFSPAFVEGMRQIDRQRRLGDEVPREVDGVLRQAISDTVIPEGPIWSGNALDPYAIPGGPMATSTPTTVHVALFLYHKDQPKLDELTTLAEAALASYSVTIVRRIDLCLREDHGRIREHFGFVDGISQPVPYGPTIVPDRRNPWHAVAAGDLLIGHLTADGDPAPGPIVSDMRPGADALPQGTAPHGFGDLGLDGTYLVIRELRQDVRAFWESMNTAARDLDRGRDYDHDWLAARVVGRTLDGDPLAPKPNGIVAREKGRPANEFGYRHDDPNGLGCPIGSHIRRANPRDGLAPNLGDAIAFRDAANNHRILRRGRSFGPPFAEKPDAERGLLFMAINTDITRQFEFIQQTWVFNKSFAALSGETDPLVGPKGPFTVPDEPVRARPEVETFVRLVGGDYFFLPSLAALRYLEQL
jgi:Dyp-type peroxidase family